MDKHTDPTKPAPKLTTYHGSCHCGAVRYQVDLDLGDGATRCNCTLCTKIGGLGKVTKPEAFKLLSGEEELGGYECGAKVARRRFCKHCGVHLFALGNLPELGGAFVGLYVNTLDDMDPGALEVRHWDGRHDNWEAGTRDRPWPIFTT